MTETNKPQPGTDAARAYQALFGPGGPLSDIPDCPERWLFVDDDTGVPFPGVEEFYLGQQQVWDPLLIPDIGDDPRGYWRRSERDLQLDQEVQNLGIVEAYRRWCGKMEPKVGNRRESIMISCPIPGHEDHNPSAWLNSEKNVGNCALCGGFDIWDLLAIHAGSWPGYKTEFGELRARMASELGFSLVESGGGESLRPAPASTVTREPIRVREPVTPPYAEYQPRSEPQPKTEPPPALNDNDQYEDDQQNAERFQGTAIEWRELLNPKDSTFLWDWMQANSITDLPDEFYFWVGLVGLGMCVGNEVQLADLTPVRANLLVCLLGASGVGKSRSISAMTKLLDNLGGIERTDPESAQAIHKRLLKPIIDPNDSNIVEGHEPVKYLGQIDEFSSLVARQARSSSTIKQAIMQVFDSAEPFGYDAKTEALAPAQGHFVSVLTTTQPASLERLLDSNDATSGFLNRWVYATGKVPTPQAWGPPDPIDVPAFTVKMRKIRDWADSVTEPLALETQAKQKWEKFFTRELAQYRDGTAENSAVFTRGELLLKKLMLLFAIDGRRKWISVADVERAIKLWPYLRRGYAFIGGQTTVTAVVKSQDQLYGNITRALGRKGPLDAQGLSKAINANTLKKLGGKPALLVALDILVKSGDLEVTKSVTKLSTKVVYSLVLE